MKKEDKIEEIKTNFLKELKKIEEERDIRIKEILDKSELEKARKNINN